MTQTRTFLIFAWIFVAFLLWTAWDKHHSAPSPVAADSPTMTQADPSVVARADSTVPSAEGLEAPSAPDATGVPALGDAPAPSAASPAGEPIDVFTDVLHLQIDPRGGTILRAELLGYGVTADDDAPPVALLDTRPATYFVAQFGLTSAGDIRPSHEEAFRTEDGARSFRLAEGQDALEVPFVWTHESGLSVRRVYRLERDSYVLQVREEVRNDSDSAWVGAPYCQLQRVEPVSPGSGFTNPAAYAFTGGAFYTPAERYTKVKFDNFAREGARLPQSETGWIAMLQHHFTAACIADTPSALSMRVGRAPSGAPAFIAGHRGSGVQVAPGSSEVITTRAWIGPKLHDRLAETAPSLERAVDFGRLTILASPLFWVLSKLYWLFGNWGWAIVGLVVLIKLVFFKLSEMQYKSFAKMRAVQPRIEQLKERYGDDKQKFQMAMMELYKKEKINPMGGCLPILVQIPVFIALYWVLLESVEIRHAPWILWIQSLTDRDPYFILPVINMVAMWATQKLTPTPGMDPFQKKLMMMMPLAFGVLFAFFPAGLVLYWTTNGLLGLAQQWYMIRRHGSSTSAVVKKD
jgi:YidC/Oxa1 family membrane protein insertase